MQRGNSKHGLKNTLQMLLLGFFISCFKQLCLALAPSRALSPGITALHRHHLLRTLPCCTRGWSGPIWKSKRSFESLPARWKHCQSPSFNLEVEQSPSGRRERSQLVASPGARGQRPAPAAAAPGGRGGAASLQLGQGVANTHWGGRAQLWERSLCQSWPLWGHCCCDHRPRAVGEGSREMLGCTRQSCSGEGL